MKVNHYNSHLLPHKTLIEMKYHHNKPEVSENKCFDWVSGRENLVTILWRLTRDEKSLTDKNELMFSNITESDEFYITEMLTVNGGNSLWEFYICH